MYANGIDVSVSVTREMCFDNDGKPITVNLKVHAKEIITSNFASLNDFLTKWQYADKRAAIINELEEQGVLVEALQDTVNKNVNLFD